MSKPDNFFSLDDLSKGVERQLASGILSKVFPGDQAMISVLSFEPNSEGVVHAHPEEQWGMVLEGSGTRFQDGMDVPVSKGDFWCTPGEVEHTFRAGPDGARLLDIFAPPRDAYRQPGSGFGIDT